VRQGLGVGQLRIKFGGRNKTRGVKPEHFKKASGGLIRHIIKQLETVGFMEKHTGARARMCVCVCVVGCWDGKQGARVAAVAAQDGSGGCNSVAAMWCWLLQG
jgi:hypothetical protein